MYTLITVDGKEAGSKEKMTLEEMQKFVGGYIEVINMNTIFASTKVKYQEKTITQVICNEEGHLRGLAKNTTFPIFVGNIILKHK